LKKIDTFNTPQGVAYKNSYTTSINYPGYTLPILNNSWALTLLPACIWDSTSLLPMSSLCAPYKGYNGQERIGNQIYLHKILVTGDVTVAAGFDISSDYLQLYTAPVFVRLILALDRMPNARTVPETGESMMESAGDYTISTLPAIWFTQANGESERFCILDEIVLEIPGATPTIMSWENEVREHISLTLTGVSAATVVGTHVGNLTGVVGAQPYAGTQINDFAITGTLEGTSGTLPELPNLTEVTSYFVPARRKRFEVAYEWKSPLRINYGVDLTPKPVDNAINLYGARDTGPSVDVVFWSSSYFTDNI